MRIGIGLVAAALIVAAPWHRAAAQERPVPTPPPQEGSVPTPPAQGGPVLPPPAQEQLVLTYHGDMSRSGNYTVPALTWERAPTLHPDTLFEGSVSGHVYAQPLYWRAPGSNTAMLLVATENDVVEALDASSGKRIWTQTVGTPVPGSSLPCGNIDPLGITGTPVIDPKTQAIYFDAAIKGPSGPSHRIFALSLKDGSILQGWPIDVATALGLTGKTFEPMTQNQRAALTIIDDMLYVPFGGLDGDCGTYRGWVIGIPLNGPHSPVLSFATRARGGGIWGPGGVSVLGGELFFATGNTFGANTWSDGEAVFRLTPSLSRLPGQWQYFTPSNWKMLDDNDLDLGGSNIIPFDVPAASGNQALMLALGKDGNAYLLDRTNLGGIGGQLDVETVSTTAIRTSPAVYPGFDSAYVAFQAPGKQCPNASSQNDLTVLKITSGSPPAMSTAWCGNLSGAGSVMVTTTDGRSNPIVWILGAEGDNRLHGFNGYTGEPLFTSKPMTGLRHFQTLIATPNRLYVGADGHVYAFDF
jgi:hypothetical protein